MYTVINSKETKVIFAGPFPQGYADDLMMRQMGYLCRKELIIQKFGDILSEFMMGSSVSNISVSNLINFFILNKSNSTKSLYSKF